MKKSYLHQAAYVFASKLASSIVSWLVGCLKDYIRGSRPILTKLGGMMGHGPGKNPLNSGADLNPSDSEFHQKSYTNLNENKSGIVYVSHNGLTTVEIWSRPPML